MSVMERDTETLIDTQLRNLLWIEDPKNPKRNVYKQQPKTDEQKKKLRGLKPDYVLYRSDSDAPLIVIEAKKPRRNIHEALQQGMAYAERINAPIVFATDGVFTKTIHQVTKQPLLLNGNEIDEFIREVLAIQYIGTSEYNSIDKHVAESRKELISIFDKANDLLREEGLHAGVERFSEFSNLLFLKLISEREDVREEETPTDDIIQREFRWGYFKNKRGNELSSYINDIVLKYFKEKFDDKTIFEPLKISNPRVLEKIVDMLDPLYLTDTNTDIKGDAFEHFLKSYSSGNHNDLGQYFTPRHIVKTLVKLLAPKLGEKIYDPFCGTGGMLTETFKHIDCTMPQNENSKWILKHQTIFGREITSVARIAKMNMILIGDSHTNVKKINSLEHIVNGEYDVVVTNIPFSQTTKHGDNYDLPTTNGDSICIQHCLKALNKKNPESRAGIIVPEGFLFDKTYAKEREYIVEKYDLRTVVSLPAGVFLPYTPQKTNILYVKNKTAKKEKIWFFDVKNDGFTLDNYRRKVIGETDLDRLLDGIDFDTLSIKEIKNHQYQLVKTIYQRKGFISEKNNTVMLKEIAEIKHGQGAPQKLDFFKDGVYPFFRVSDLAKEHISYDLTVSKDKLNDKGIKGLTLFPKGTILFPKSGISALKNHRGILGCEGYVVSHFACILPDINKVDPYFLLYCLLHIRAEDLLLNKGYPSIRKETFESIHIPLLSMEQQKEVVKPIYEIIKLNRRVKELESATSEKFNSVI